MTNAEDREAHQQYLREYLEGLKRAYGFTGQAFWLPEQKSKEYYIALYNSLSVSQKVGIAEKFGWTPEEYIENLQAESLLDDPKYANVSPSERVFYITVDLLLGGIEKAAKGLDLQADSEMIFGLLPTGEFNAVTIIPPGDKGCIIAVNYGTFLFLHLIGILFSRFLDKWYGEKNEYNPENPALPRMIEDCLDYQTNRLFADLILSYVCFTFPGFLLNDSTPEALRKLMYDSISGVGLEDRLLDSMLSFILSHEYIHACPKVTSTIKAARQSKENRDKLSEEIVRSWSEEFVADSLGLRLSHYATAIYLAQDDLSSLSDHYFVALVRAFLGAHSVMSCERVLDDCISSTDTLKEGELLVTSHPPAHARITNLKEMLRQITDGIGKDSGLVFRQVLQTAEIFDKFIDTLWRLNKDKIASALSQLWKSRI